MDATRKVQVATSEIVVPAGRRQLAGTLSIPKGARGVIAFAHGSGSSRFSPRNQFVAETLQHCGLATLLFDLLNAQEADDRSNVFDIDLLASRLGCAADWLHGHSETRKMLLGYFGASTGAAAALVADARHPGQVAAIVSRGGRPDLAGEELPAVGAPTLLIVGGDDHEVLQLNEQALHRLRCTKELVVVPGATHLFPEPGALEEVARLARDWFIRFLVSQAPIER